MKLNKKGFTLIELLAVVVIMLAISVMAVSSISAAIKRNNKKQDDAKIKVLVSYAELYYQKHKNNYVNGTGSICVGEYNFQKEFNISEEELTNSADIPFDGCIEFQNGTNFKYIPGNEEG